MPVDAPPPSPTGSTRSPRWHTYQHPRPSLMFVVRGVITRLLEIQVWDIAATMTFYLFLSLLPGIVVLVSWVSLLGMADETISTIAALVHELIPTLDPNLVASTLFSLGETSGSVWVIVIGSLASLYSAGNVIAAFHRAMHRLYSTREGRPFIIFRTIVFFETLVLMVAMIALVLLLILGGDFSARIGALIGLTQESVDTWNAVKWVVILVVLILVVSLAYYRGPNVKLPRYRFMTSGGIIVVLLLFSALALTGWILDNFSIFDGIVYTINGAIYVILMVWVGTIVLIAGAAWDAELLRARQLAEGLAAWDELQLAPKHTLALESLEYRARLTDYIGHVVVHSVRTKEPIATLKTMELTEKGSLFSIAPGSSSSSTGTPFRSQLDEAEFGAIGRSKTTDDDVRTVLPPEKPDRPGLSEYVGLTDRSDSDDSDEQKENS